MRQSALPPGIPNARENFIELAQVSKQLNALKGELGRARPRPRHEVQGRATRANAIALVLARLIETSTHYSHGR
jgi:hypothetical protein